MLDAHITIKRYWFLNLVKRSTQLIITLLNGSWNAGIGFSGGMGMVRCHYNLTKCDKFYKILLVDLMPVEMFG